MYRLSRKISREVLILIPLPCLEDTMTTTQTEEVHNSKIGPKGGDLQFVFNTVEDLEDSSAKVLRALSQDDSIDNIDFVGRTYIQNTFSSTTPVVSPVSRNSSSSSNASSPLDRLAELASLESPSSSSSQSAIAKPVTILYPSTKPVDGRIDIVQGNSNTTTHILENDVLCGRGGLTNHHVGNIKFRQLVRAMQPAYLLACKRDKAKIAELVVETIRTKFHPPGRFLRRQDSSSLAYSGINNEQLKGGIWADIGDHKAREKTSQALREGAPVIREDVFASAARSQESLLCSNDNTVAQDTNSTVAVSNEHLDYMRCQYLKILAQSESVNKDMPETMNQQLKAAKRRKESTKQ
jgi:hypothetical protein